MPAPKGNKNTLKHGVYAFKSRGKTALTPIERSRWVELREQVEDKNGQLAIKKDKATDMVLMFEMVQSFVASEVRNGVPLTSIPAVKLYSLIFNGMERALVSLWAMTPGDEGIIDAAKILSEIKRKDGNDNPETEDHG